VVLAVRRAFALAALACATASAQAPAPVASRGHVVDQLLEPVPGAEVWANDATDSRELWRTKADGSGEFPCLPTDGRAVLHASAPGRVCTGHAWGQRDPPPQLLLQDADPVAGEVVDAQGKPVAGAWVTAGTQSVATGADGRFRFELVSPLGEVALDVVHEVGTLRVVIPAAEREHCRIALADAGPPIRVRVRGLTGAELRGCRLQLGGKGVAAVITLPAATHPGAFERPDPYRVIGPTPGDDSFVVLGLGRREVLVTPVLDGYEFAPPQRTIAHDAADRVLVFEAKPTPAPAMITLRGRVLDDQGLPLAGQRLSCTEENAHIGSSTSGGAVTGGDGGFALTLAVAAGASVVFGLGPGPWLLDGDRGSEWRDLHVAGRHGAVADPDRPLTLTARRGAEVRGRVLGADGQPAAFAAVVIRHATVQPAPRGLLRLPLHLPAFALTDADGRFAFVGLADCGCEFRVVGVVATARAVSEPFALERGAPTVLDALRLEPMAEVRLLVRDGTAAAAGARVQCQLVSADDDADEDDAESGWTEFQRSCFVRPTDRQGRARVTGLRAGKYTFTVSGPDGRSATQSLHVAKDERASVELALPPRAAAK
jgi:hypothetical protein